jgi:hypothetical protein
MNMKYKKRSRINLFLEVCSVILMSNYKLFIRWFLGLIRPWTLIVPASLCYCLFSHIASSTYTLRRYHILFSILLILQWFMLVKLAIASLSCSPTWRIASSYYCSCWTTVTTATTCRCIGSIWSLNCNNACT